MGGIFSAGILIKFSRKLERDKYHMGKVTAKRVICEETEEKKRADALIRPILF
jgi:lipid-binding SYLF domain-containing protein